jgi:8-oxo-dGTP pyrophosphatase MutT (NUDIX family)
MRWLVRSERSVFKDQWLDVREADVELPDGRHLNHKVIHSAPGAGAVVLNDDMEVLLLWRHRFITDTWGYEIPIGRINDGEEPVDAARREFIEETGWAPGPLQPLIYVQPSNGIMTSQHHIFYAAAATRVAAIEDAFESDRLEWVPLARVTSLIADQKIVSGTTVAALLYVVATR